MGLVLGVGLDDAESGSFGFELAGLALGLVGHGLEGGRVTGDGEQLVDELATKLAVVGRAAGELAGKVCGTAVGCVAARPVVGVVPDDVVGDVEAEELGDREALAGLGMGDVEPDDLAGAIVAVSSACLHSRRSGGGARTIWHFGVATSDNADESRVVMKYLDC